MIIGEVFGELIVLSQKIRFIECMITNSHGSGCSVIYISIYIPI